MLPKFWQFLSSAAYGNAHVVMISVLPFVSTLPDEVSTEIEMSRNMELSC